MAVMTTGSFPKLLWPGINKIANAAYKLYQEQWAEIFEKNTSYKAYEEDVGMTGLGLMPVKPQGEAITYDTMKQSYVTRYTHVAYALGYIITHEEIQDNLYPEFAKFRTEQLVRSAFLTKEIIGANVLNNGFSGSYPGGDAVALFATNHPIEGGTFSNTPATQVDVSEAAIEQAIIDIRNFVDNRGNKIAVNPKKIIVPTASEFDIRRILDNPVQPDTAERNISALYQSGALPGGYKVNRYLTDSDSWFIITDCPVGLRYFERQAGGMRDDNDFETMNAKFSYYARYSFGWTDPRGAYGSQGG